MKPFSKIFILASATALLGAGCISFSGSASGKALDGGMWRTVDRGENWMQKAIVPTPRGITTMGGTNISTFAIDPEDRKALYAGTEENGLYYSYDGGDGWDHAVGLTGARVNAVVVDFRDKCTIHVAMGARILRSTDCNRTWQGTYFESRRDQTVTALVMDPKNPIVLYAGISNGDLIRSVDGGGSWATLKRFDNRVTKIAINKTNTTVVYVGTGDGGLFRSADAGITWNDFNRAWQQQYGAKNIYGIQQLPEVADGWVVASRYGLMRTTDGGAAWEQIQLLTQPGGVTITTLAVDPKNGKNIYYTTAGTLYRTQDGGATWVTRKIPTTRVPRALMVDPEDGNLLYLGVAAVKK